MVQHAELTLQGATALTVIRDFSAPRARVWQAFTEPTLLRQWLLGPPGWEMHICEMDLRVGGTYRWRWRNLENAAEFGFSGTYFKVEPQVHVSDRQVYDQGPDATPLGDATENGVTFAELAEDRTRVETSITYGTEALRRMVLDQGMVAGMEASYGRLDALLAKG